MYYGINLSKHPSPMLRFCLLMLAGFVGMELLSYIVHRFLFHGILWRIHATHHRPGHGTFEANDLFSLVFSLASIGLIVQGASDPLASVGFPVGVGIAVYGILYFVLHDLYTHRRFFPFRSDNRLFGMIRRAHQRHHQSAEKDGLEPYGLFLFPYGKFRRPFQRRRRSREKADE